MPSNIELEKQVNELKQEVADLKSQLATIKASSAESMKSELEELKECLDTMFSHRDLSHGSVWSAVVNNGPQRIAVKRKQAAEYEAQVGRRG